MSRITFTAEEHHEDIIADVKDEIDVESTAGAVRECIERAAVLKQREATLQQRVDDLEQELESKEKTINELRSQLAATNRRVDEHQELVAYVQEERSLERRRAEAGVLTRTKWWFTGMPTDGE